MAAGRHGGDALYLHARLADNHDGSRMEPRRIHIDRARPPCYGPRVARSRTAGHKAVTVVPERANTLDHKRLTKTERIHQPILRALDLVPSRASSVKSFAFLPVRRTSAMTPPKRRSLT